MKKIKSSDIRLILEKTGESLLDNGADWIEDFGLWLKEFYPTVFNKLEVNYSDEYEVELYEKYSLGFSDSLIAEYCNIDRKANKFIVRFLKMYL